MSSYATVAQFDVYGIRPEALPAGISSDDKTAAIEAASRVADSYLGAQFHLPLSAWGADLSQNVCSIAAYELIASLLVFQPEAAKNEVLTERKEAAIRWLEQVAAGRVRPVGISDTAPSAMSVPRVYSKTPRGW